MNDANLYTKILGLRKPWQVLDVTVNEALKTITVLIGPQTGSPMRSALSAHLPWLRQPNAPLAGLGYLRVSDQDRGRYSARAMS